MFKNVLLCYDGSAEGRRALRQGADVVLCMQSEAYLLAICRSMMASSVPEGITPELVMSEDNSAEALLREGVEWLRARGITARGSLVYGDPLQHVPRIAKEIDADLVVLGYRHRGRLARWWTDSPQQGLLERVNCSILVAMAETG
jgi:nucleotide-binding universal stress UspA family protein